MTMATRPKMQSAVKTRISLLPNQSFALSGVEENLQGADTQGKESDAPEIDFALAALYVARIEDEAVHQDERQDADREIEVEDPAPAVVVGDPSTERGAEDGREQNADAEGGHGVAVAFFRESF